MQLSVKDVSELLQVSEKTVYRWIEEGKLPGYRLNAQYRFNRYELLEWATAHRLPLSPAIFDEKEASSVPRPELGTALDAGGDADWRAVMSRSAALHDALVDAGLTSVAPYAVAMAYRVRFVMDMNAREAMHVIELRTAPAGHPAYRRVCQQMHRLIDTVAGHHAIAASMQFADHSEVELERLQEERRLEARRQARR
jgi:excisionase family DNA binding protein